MAKCVCPQCGHEFSPVRASPAAVEDLTRTLKRPKARGAYSAGFTALWADGSETSQTVICASEKDRWPAAFQACDRLRRLRSRHELGWVLVLIHGACGVLQPHPEYQRYVMQREMPALKRLRCDDTGETYEPLKPAGADSFWQGYGQGDHFEAEVSLAHARIESQTAWGAIMRAAMWNLPEPWEYVREHDWGRNDGLISYVVWNLDAMLAPLWAANEAARA